MNKEVSDIVGNGKLTGSVRKETIAAESFSEMFHAAECENASRYRSPRGKSPSGRMFRLPCKDYFFGTCTNSFCEKWHPPECLFYKSENGCRFGEKCSSVHSQVDERPSKRP